MCDFFSAIIRHLGDGIPAEVYHDETNSHSGMVRTKGWRENTPERQTFWEFEWDGTGTFRGVRGDGVPPEVVKAADLLAEDLASALRGKFSPRMRGYMDVRHRVAGNPATPPKTLAVLAKDEDASVRHRVANNPAMKGRQ